MEAKDMHRHIAGATPVEPPPAPPEQSPLPGPDMPLVPEPPAVEQMAPPVESAPPVPDSPKAREIKEELTHLDEIEATLPAHDDDDGNGNGGEEDDGGHAKHFAGSRKKHRKHG
jgi:hypothetical protein